MAKLTEDQERAFGDRMTELLGDAGTAAALQEKNSGLDPTKRSAALKAKQDAAAKSEAAQTKAKADWMRATDESQAATDAYYKEASSAAKALVAELGDNHPLSHQITRLRGSMSNPGARGGSGDSGGATPPAPATP